MWKHAISGCCIGLVLALLSSARPALAEDGYELWLRYAPLPPDAREEARGYAAHIVAPPEPSPTATAALNELRAGLGRMLRSPLATTTVTTPTATPATTSKIVDRSIVLGTPSTSKIVRRLDLPFEQLGDDGFVIRSRSIDGHPVTVIAANRDIGLVYGTFALLRQLETGHSLAALDIVSAPKIELRLLDHWDNLDRTVERGYAGQSIWDWWRLPDFHDPRYLDYARANASIGINGAVLNNVNADPDVLTPRYLAKAAALADIFRPWGIRVYLSARFTAPIDLGGLATADPLDPAVRAWWAAKADEIYAAIPDFGGFVVKANSEGQPGPQDYGRSHAEGANALAAALAPHGGVVMWRAFVYSQHDPEDRAKQAYNEFKPLDGKFADNVLIQVKNGPIDFQPREPIHPLFGAMPETSLMLEFQLTKEYLGFSTHLVYLGALYEEVLKTDTYAEGAGSTVAKIIDGRLHPKRRTGIAGVSNIGSDRDWSGSIFNQADWYAFGRLAWDPERSAKGIAEEWLRLTFSNDERFLQPALDMMMNSREAVVDYMTPLGLAHLMATGHHYGPGPWVSDLDRPEWNPTYYHRADADGIGFDRTASGSNAVSQYAPALAEKYGNVESVPEKFLLWFHHLPWDYRMSSGMSSGMASGKTLWQELVAHYDRGVVDVERMQATWKTLKPFVDRERFEKTATFLAIQHREALWWRDACLAYFSHVSGRKLPAGERPPAHTLEYYKSLHFPNAPGH